MANESSHLDLHCLKMYLYKSTGLKMLNEILGFKPGFMLSVSIYCFSNEVEDLTRNEHVFVIFGGIRIKGDTSIA